MSSSLDKLILSAQLNQTLQATFFPLFIFFHNLSLFSWPDHQIMAFCHSLLHLIQTQLHPLATDTDAQGFNVMYLKCKAICISSQKLGTEDVQGQTKKNGLGWGGGGITQDSHSHRQSLAFSKPNLNSTITSCLCLDLVRVTPDQEQISRAHAFVCHLDTLKERLSTSESFFYIREGSAC